MGFPPFVGAVQLMVASAPATVAEGAAGAAGLVTVAGSGSTVTVTEALSPVPDTVPATGKVPVWA